MPTNEERIATLEAVTGNHDGAIKEMGADIKDIKDKLLLRPSWATLTIITLLSTVCASLLVYVITNIR